MEIKLRLSVAAISTIAGAATLLSAGCADYAQQAAKQQAEAARTSAMIDCLVPKISVVPGFPEGTDDNVKRGWLIRQIRNTPITGECRRELGFIVMVWSNFQVLNDVMKGVEEAHNRPTDVR
jgi:hypothetical protein